MIILEFLRDDPMIVLMANQIFMKKLVMHNIFFIPFLIFPSITKEENITNDIHTALMVDIECFDNSFYHYFSYFSIMDINTMDLNGHCFYSTYFYM